MVESAASEVVPAGQPPADESTLGTRIRAARLAAGVTLRGFARRLGVSPSLISQIERDRVMPSVGTLYAIANELGFSMDELFTEAGASATRRTPGDGATSTRGTSPVQRRATRKAISLSGGVRWEQLAPTAGDNVEFLHVTYEPGAASCAPDALIRHGGREYGVVTGGTLGVTIGFQDYELGPGDSVVFDSRLPHRLWTVGDEPATAIWFVVNRHSDSRSGVAPAD